MWQHHRLFFFNPKLIYFLVYRLRVCHLPISSSSVCSRRKDLFERVGRETRLNIQFCSRSQNLTCDTTSHSEPLEQKAKRASIRGCTAVPGTANQTSWQSIIISSYFIFTCQVHCVNKPRYTTVIGLPFLYTSTLPLLLALAALYIKSKPGCDRLTSVHGFTNIHKQVNQPSLHKIKTFPLSDFFSFLFHFSCLAFEA